MERNYWCNIQDRDFDLLDMVFLFELVDIMMEIIQVIRADLDIKTTLRCLHKDISVIIFYTSLDPRLGPDTEIIQY